MTAARIAAADVGSNTVHLLVAEPGDGGRLGEIRRVVTMPRVGAAVGATGRIGEAKIAEVCAILRSFAQIARDCAASAFLLCATEAVRRAADRDTAVAAFSAAAGVPCVVIPGEVEARLSFRGAVAMAGDGVSGDGTHALALVCDIGGGSTEFAMGSGGDVAALVSLPVGSGAATDRWLHDDPPTTEQRHACYAGILDVLSAAPPGRPEHAIATGGTAASLPRLLGLPHDAAALSAADLESCRRILAAAPSAHVAAQHGLDPARARVLAGGVEIVDAVREGYDLDRIHVTIHGLRTGMILAHLAGGERWVDG